MSKIIADLGQESYDFLRTNPDLRNIVYLTLSGSYGYGTNHDGSDIDLRGFLIEDKKYLFGLKAFEQFEDLATDTVIYSLKKFIALCTNGNPNTLELLGTDEADIVFISDAGRYVRENAHLFLSKRIVESFGNYAAAQLRRLANALCHDRYEAEKQERHLLASLNSQISHFNRTYRSFGKNGIRLYLEEERGSGEITADIHLERYPLRDFAGIYSEMSNTIKTYHKLNHRNRKKDGDHLNKHAMHLIRLLITGMDILDGKGIRTKRVREHGFLMDIREGRYSYDEIFQITEEYRIKFDESAGKTKLPDEPDRSKIEEMQIELYEKFSRV